jgi:hypothetical protein
MEDDVEQEEDTPVDQCLGVLLELEGSGVVLLGEEPTCS